MKKKTLKALSVLLAVCMLVLPTLTVFASSVETSFDFRYDDKQTTVKLFYPDYKRLINEEYSTTPVPGVEKTKFSDDDVATSMVPQGLCIAGDYLLVTAYDYEKKHNSVIYVMSNDDPTKRELVSTLILPDKNHVGGITFDGEYVWVARSSEKEVGKIKLKTIEKASEKDVNSVDYAGKLKCETTASFITYYDSKLWIGLFDEDNESTLQGYSLNSSKSKLKLECTVKIPEKCQGAVFVEDGDDTYLVTSSSYGRNRSSYLRSYEFSYDGEKGKATLLNEYTFPPMTEELELCGDKILIMTEAPATEYSTKALNKCILPMDRITAVDIDNFVEEDNGWLFYILEKISEFIDSLF